MLECEMLAHFWAIYSKAAAMELIAKEPRVAKAPPERNTEYSSLQPQSLLQFLVLKIRWYLPKGRHVGQTVEWRV